MSDKDLALDLKAARDALMGLGLVPGATTLPLADLVLSLAPRDPSLQAKDVAVEQLFGKVTAMRDKLRVLEQRVNAADGLDAAERASLQVHVTATAEALTGLLAFFSEQALPSGTASTDGGTGNTGNAGTGSAGAPSGAVIRRG